MRARFVCSMKSMLPLRHPNLVTVFGEGKSGLTAGAPWNSARVRLTEVIQRFGVPGLFDWKYALRVAVHVGRALEDAHGQGIIHCDVSPVNIPMSTEDKVLKLDDLMLAKAFDGASAQQAKRPALTEITEPVRRERLAESLHRLIRLAKASNDPAAAAKWRSTGISAWTIDKSASGRPIPILI